MDMNFADQVIGLKRGNNTISHIAAAVASAALGAVLIAVVSLAVPILWDYLGKKARFFQLMPGPLAVLALGIVLNRPFGRFIPSLQLVSAQDMVDLPVPKASPIQEHRNRIEVMGELSDIRRTTTWNPTSACC
jgi:hypothetical protein